MIINELKTEETGKHRYVFLLYRHGPGTKDITGPSDNRKNWGTEKPRHGARKWADEHNLTLVGMVGWLSHNIYANVMVVSGANFFFSENSK